MLPILYITHLNHKGRFLLILFKSSICLTSWQPYLIVFCIIRDFFKFWYRIVAGIYLLFELVKLVVNMSSGKVQNRTTPTTGKQYSSFGKHHRVLAAPFQPPTLSSPPLSFSQLTEESNILISIDGSSGSGATSRLDIHTHVYFKVSHF